MNICIIVPHYDHLEQFREFLPSLESLGLPLLLVDDASSASARDELADLLLKSALDSQLIQHARNRGKGAAVMTGIGVAFETGFTHALQIDADGQHDVSHVADFLSAAVTEPNSIVCGQPVFDESVSRLRFYARHITLFFSHLETLSFEIRDAMCGFRLYPLLETQKILRQSKLSERMAFDTEILVRAVWAKIPLQFIPVRVSYPEGGKSHFQYWRDNLEMSWMHTRMLFGMLLRSPRLIGRNRARRRARRRKGLST
jgi:glycosyltransferase involved in cell wall biosynthesis